LLDNVNKSLADQQIKDGQFEFKTGKAEFAAGNEKRVSGLMKFLTENSKMLKTAFPKLHVATEGHTDTEAAQRRNRNSLWRAQRRYAPLSRPRE
jgi:outer membrane protein OmpA-like peptidoglycan-associated protein